VEQQQKHRRRLQTFSIWQVQQEADTHHVCRPGWGSPRGLHKVGSLRQLLSHTRHILHRQMLSGIARPSTMSYKSPKTTECTSTGISMQKSTKQICWHQCLFTDDKVSKRADSNGFCMLQTFTDRQYLMHGHSLTSTRSCSNTTDLHQTVKYI